MLLQWVAAPFVHLTVVTCTLMTPVAVRVITTKARFTRSRPSNIAKRVQVHTVQLFTMLVYTTIVGAIAQ